MNTEILRIVVEGVDKNLSMVAKQVKGSLDSLRATFIGFNNVIKTSSKQMEMVNQTMMKSSNIGVRFATHLHNINNSLKDQENQDFQHF